MRYISIVLILLFYFCSKPERSNINRKFNNSKIESIIFSNNSTFVENPDEIPENITTIIVNEKNIFLCKETYKNNKLIKVDTIKSLQTNNYEKGVFDKIPDKYLKKDSRFGDINSADEGSLGVTINMKNDEQVFIELSHQITSLPKDIQILYQLNNEAEKRLFTKK